MAGNPTEFQLPKGAYWVSRDFVQSLEALLGVAQGMTEKEIAQQMQITPGTVANRIENAMFKLGVGRRAAAVAEAMRRQIISPLCFAFASFIAMHSTINDGDPIRLDRRPPERRVAKVQVVRHAEPSVKLA